MALTLFDWLKEITLSKRKWGSFTDDDRASFNVYMTHKYLSMNQEYIDIVNYIQTIPYTEKEKIYRIYCEMIPKKNVWLKYIKSSKKRTSDNLLQYIAKEYTISLGEAEEYTYILGKEGIIEILTKHGVDEKEQKKLLKDLVL
jgi:hypothetical protein